MKTVEELKKYLEEEINRMKNLKISHFSDVELMKRGVIYKLEEILENISKN